MKNECFLDTNILIYALAGKNDEPIKFARAQSLFLEKDFCLSAQVLAEFYVNAVKRIGQGIDAGDVDRWINALEQFPILPVDIDIVRGGIVNSHKFQISYWDGAIIAAADRLQAPILYSEDLNHGQKYGSVTVINPFKAN